MFLQVIMFPPWKESGSAQKPDKGFSLGRGTSPACTGSHSANKQPPDIMMAELIFDAMGATNGRVIFLTAM